MRGYRAFAAYYDGLTANVSYGDRAEYFDTLIRRFAPSDGGNLLLDLACGTGSLSVELAKRGYDVIGVDGSMEMLAVARQKAVETVGCTAENPLFLCQEMTRLDLYGTIDAAVCALDSLNHLPSARAVARTLERVSLFLAPGGIFLFDMNTLYKHRQVLANNAFVYETEAVFCVWQNSLQPDEQTVDITLDFFAQEGEHYYRETEQFQERAYPLEQIEEMVRQAGLEILDRYEGDGLQPVGETTERAVFVTRKRG